MQTTVLLSIKSKYAQKIFNGEKKYEFRKTIPQKSFRTVIVYSSEEEKMVVGQFYTKNTICKSPEELWEICNDFSGISKEDFFKYFRGHDVAYAIEIESYEKYPKPKPITNYASKPPQSFMYIKL